PDEPLPADPQGQRMLVSGTVTDASSLQPVRGAFVIALRPGSEDDSLGSLGETVIAWSQTDATGRFTLEPPLPRGHPYTAGVTAPGYLPAIEIASLDVPPDDVHRLLPWRTILLRRDWSL